MDHVKTCKTYSNNIIHKCIKCKITSICLCIKFRCLVRRIGSRVRDSTPMIVSSPSTRANTTQRRSKSACTDSEIREAQTYAIHGRCTCIATADSIRGDQPTKAQKQPNDKCYFDDDVYGDPCIVEKYLFDPRHRSCTCVTVFKVTSIGTHFFHDSLGNIERRHYVTDT